MAINTANERRSIMSLSIPFRGAIPVPSGNLDSGERAILLYLYSGILQTGEGGGLSGLTGLSGLSGIYGKG